MTKSTGKGKGRWGKEGSGRLPTAGPCSIDGCSAHRVAKGMCRNHYSKYRYDTNPRIKRGFLQWRWGLPDGAYEIMLDAQGGVCAICGAEPSGKHLCVDHDHDSGEIRALLCRGCNTGIGGLKDDPATVMKAYDYLKRFGK